MKTVRFAALALTLLLAACGGGGTTTPPVDPTTPTEPTTPVDPTDSTDPTTPVDPTDGSDPTTPVDPTTTVDPTTPVDPTDPTTPDDPSEVPFYGQWIVTFTSDAGTTFAHSLSITDLPPAGSSLQNGGFGAQVFCVDPAGSCSDVADGSFASGIGFIGELPLDDGSTPLTVAIFNNTPSSDTPELKVLTVGDPTPTTGANGNQIIEDDAVWIQGGEIFAEGSVTAERVGDPLQIDTGTLSVDSASLNRSINSFKGAR